METTKLRCLEQGFFGAKRGEVGEVELPLKCFKSCNEGGFERLGDAELSHLQIHFQSVFSERFDLLIEKISLATEPQVEEVLMRHRGNDFFPVGFYRQETGKAEQRRDFH